MRREVPEKRSDVLYEPCFVIENCINNFYIFITFGMFHLSLTTDKTIISINIKLVF